MKSFFQMVGFADGCAAHDGCDFVARVALCAGLGQLVGGLY